MHTCISVRFSFILGFSYVVTLIWQKPSCVAYFVFLLYICVWVYWVDGNKFMYVCMYVCMYVSTHLCLFVCMYVCMYVCKIPTKVED